MKVAKFGGSSLATADCIRQVFDIVTADPQRRLIVVSAPGKRHSDDIKVTDLLIALAEACLAEERGEEELAAVVRRYQQIADELGVGGDVIGDIESDLQARMDGDPSDRGMFTDVLKAAGEDNCAKLIAAYFRAQGVDAAYVDPREAGMLLSDQPGNARVLPETYEKLARLGQRPGVMIFPGFFGCTRSGALVTFPRGGSDITGAIIAAAVEADVYENFTDVDGVQAANPKLIPDAKLIDELTYREMRELSYAGFSVVQDEALMPCFRAGVPVNIRNTNNPGAPGTLIVSERDSAPGGVVGVAADSGFCSIFVGKYLMNREIGFGRRLLQILEDEKLSYEHTPSGIDSISVILRGKALTAEIEERVLERIDRELEVDEVSVRRGSAMVMCVGEGMCRTVGIACRATGALSAAGVNIEMINQGSSEVSLMFGVREADCQTAVRAIYEEFFGAPLAD